MDLTAQRSQLRSTRNVGFSKCRFFALTSPQTLCYVNLPSSICTEPCKGGTLSKRAKPFNAKECVE